MQKKIKILIITNKTDITTDFIIKKLKEKKVLFYRFNTEDIGINVQISFNFLHHKYILIDKNLNITIDFLEIKSVYYRRPEINISKTGLTEGEANFIKSELLFTLEGMYKILANAFWLNNVYDIRNAENKIHQLLIAKDIGLIIPSSIITNNPSDAYQFYIENEELCIVKPIKSGLIEGSKEEGVIFTNKLSLSKDDLFRVEPCPVYLQKLVYKKADIRVTVIGDEIFPASIDSQVEAESEIDWRRSSIPLKHSPIDLPKDIITKCLILTTKLKLNFSAIDFILDKKGNYIFLEINPNGQWAWIERQLDYPISDKITSILIEKSIY